MWLQEEEWSGLNSSYRNCKTSRKSPHFYLPQWRCSLHCKNIWKKVCKFPYKESVLSSFFAIKKQNWLYWRVPVKSTTEGSIMVLIQRYLFHVRLPYILSCLNGQDDVWLHLAKQECNKSFTGFNFWVLFLKSELQNLLQLIWFMMLLNKWLKQVFIITLFHLSSQLWDITSGKLVHDFKQHTGPTTCVEFHPREFLLATASNDRFVIHWLSLAIKQALSQEGV